jgi:hypothetical protein
MFQWMEDLFSSAGSTLGLPFRINFFSKNLTLNHFHGIPHLKFLFRLKGMDKEFAKYTQI